VFDYDAIIVGGGPAGLTAGIYLSQARYRVLLLEKGTFGGQIKNVELIENYPGFPDGVSGARLASDMVTQATKHGVQLEEAEVAGLEIYSSCKVVNCVGGKGYTCGVVIIAGGSRPKKLGVPREAILQGRGIIHCALCDGGQFADRPVAVCGGGNSGVTEALYMSKLASKVILVEGEPALTAAAFLQERVLSNPRIEIRCGKKVEEFIGEDKVEAIKLLDARTGRKEEVKVDGVLVYVGIEPNTKYLEGVVPLDEEGQIIVNDKLETEVSYILAGGDIRCGSSRQVATAVGDGATVAITAQRLLQTLT